jgi:hypothetical protein
VRTGDGDNGWSGVTDRSYSRSFLDGAVTLATARENGMQSVTFAGKYGNRGTFRTVRRCTSTSTDVNRKTPQPGDVWEGHFVCDRPPASDSAKVLDGTWHARVVSLTVERVAANGELFGVVSAASASGRRGERLRYTVSGMFPTASQCQSLALSPASGPTAWTEGAVLGLQQQFALGHDIGSYYWILLMDPTIGSYYWILLLDPTIGSYYWILLLDPTIGSYYCWFETTKHVIK